MTDTPDLMSIGEFSSRSRLSVRMLRHYGEHGILAPADVVAAVSTPQVIARTRHDLRRDYAVLDVDALQDAMPLDGVDVRAERAGDLVLRARKRGYETHAFDVDATEAWYESLRGADGVGIIRGIVGNIDGTPVDLGGGLRAV